jgi:hypothetical protein
MAYFFFLKYLDSLEDFRKNPHVKIPPKSPPTNFQSLCIFKNQIVIRKRIFSSLSAQSAQRPASPSDLLAQPWPIFSLFNRPLLPLPTGPRPLDRPSPPSRPSRPSSSSSRTGAARVSRHRRSTSRHPMDGTDYLRQRKNNGRITPPSFPH